MANDRIQSAGRWRRLIPSWVICAVIAVGVAVGLRASGRLESIALAAADWFGVLSQPTLSFSDVVVVGFDDRDLSEFKIYPLPDAQINSVLTNVLEADPLVVGFCFIRQAAMPPGHDELMATLRNDPRVVGLDSTTPDSSDLNLGLPFLAAEQRAASMVAVTSSDGFARMGVMGFRHQADGSFKSGFAVALARRYIAVTQPEVTQSAPNVLNTQHGGLGSSDFAFGEQMTSDSGLFTFMLPAARVDEVPVIPFRDIVDDRFDPELLRGKIVLVATVAATTQEAMRIPGRRRAMGSVRSIAPALVHAVATQQLIDVVEGRRAGPLHTLPRWLDWLLIVGLIGLTVLIAKRLDGKRSLAVSLGAAMVAVPVLAYAAFVAGWWLPWVAASIGQLVYVALTVYLSLRRTRLIREAASLIAAVLDNIPDPLMVVDDTGRIRIANEAMCTCLGRLPDELVGHPRSAFLHDASDNPPDSRERVIEATDAYGDTWRMIAEVTRIHDTRGRRYESFVIKVANKLSRRDASASLPHRTRNALHWATQMRQELIVVSVEPIVDKEQPKAPLLEAVRSKVAEALPYCEAIWTTSDRVYALLRGEQAEYRARASLVGAFNWPIAVAGLETIIDVNVHCVDAKDDATIGAIIKAV